MNGVSMRGKRQNQRQDEESHSFRNKIAELSELPKDVALGMPVLTVTGQMELCLENYRGIIEYPGTYPDEDGADPYYRTETASRILHQ